MDIIKIADKYGFEALLVIVILLALWKMGNKIYDNMMVTQKDMMLDQKGLMDRLLKEAHDREDKLMLYLDKQEESLISISHTIEKIDNRFEGVDNRICSLEDYCRNSKKVEGNPNEQN